MNESYIERESSIDYLNPDIPVAFEMSEEAVQWFPEVSDSDLETKQEKYVALIGRAKVKRDGCIIEIRAVLDSFANTNNVFFTEQEGVIENIHIERIKHMVNYACSNTKDYHSYSFIGDLHTHPLLPSELGMHAGVPSEGDIDSIIHHYESGQLKNDEPFIFGIAAPNNNGETVYSFFRMIKNKDGSFAYMSVEKYSE